MIRISLDSGTAGPFLRAEGEAVGAFGVEFVRAVRSALEKSPELGLELGQLGSIDHTTVEFLADCGDQVVVLSAPGYVSRWLDALRRVRRLNAARA